MADDRLSAAEAWLGLAQDELASAEVLLEADPPRLRPAAHHARVAAERALRALLAWYGEEPPAGRDPAALLERAARFDRSLRDLERAAVALAAFELEGEERPAPFRAAEPEVEAAVAKARRVVERVQWLMGGADA